MKNKGKAPSERKGKKGICNRPYKEKVFKDNKQFLQLASANEKMCKIFAVQFFPLYAPQTFALAGFTNSTVQYNAIARSTDRE